MLQASRPVAVGVRGLDAASAALVEGTVDAFLTVVADVFAPVPRALRRVGSKDGEISLELKKTTAPATSGHAADEARDDLRRRRRGGGDVARVALRVALSAIWRATRRVALSVVYAPTSSLDL